MQIVLTSELLLSAYMQGIFPMAERSESSYVHWYCPEKRGQLPIAGLHISRSLKKSVLRGNFDIRINTDFNHVVLSCAKRRPQRPESWINAQIMEAYCNLHKEGFAHSVECWDGSEMVGGLYGVAIGGAFFGESMFSTVTDVSKICLVHLVARLWQSGFTVLDTQFVNQHLQQFGAYEVPYKDYVKALEVASKRLCDFMSWQEGEDKLVRLYFEQRTS